MMLHCSSLFEIDNETKQFEKFRFSSVGSLLGVGSCSFFKFICTREV